MGLITKCLWHFSQSHYNQWYLVPCFIWTCYFVYIHKFQFAGHMFPLRIISLHLSIFTPDTPKQNSMNMHFLSEFIYSILNNVQFFSLQVWNAAGTKLQLFWLNWPIWSKKNWVIVWTIMHLVYQQMVAMMPQVNNTRLLLELGIQAHDWLTLNFCQYQYVMMLLLERIFLILWTMI